MALILIVDDEKNLRLTLSEALQREGHTVLTAADGAETIDICARLSPDLILLDLILPDLNGIQLLKRIQRASGPPIIIMTADRKNTSELQSPLNIVCRLLLEKKK